MKHLACADTLSYVPVLWSNWGCCIGLLLCGTLVWFLQVLLLVCTGDTDGVDSILRRLFTISASGGDLNGMQAGYAIMQRIDIGSELLCDLIAENINMTTIASWAQDKGGWTRMHSQTKIELLYLTALHWKWKLYLESLLWNFLLHKGIDSFVDQNSMWEQFFQGLCHHSNLQN